MPSKITQTPCFFKINARSLSQNLPKLHIPPIFAISISTHRSKKSSCVRSSSHLQSLHRGGQRSRCPRSSLHSPPHGRRKPLRHKTRRLALPMTSPVVAYNRLPSDKFTSATVRNSFSNKTHPTYESLYLSLSSKSSAQR